MLFDPRPKERREDLFGRDEEVTTLVNYIRSDAPITLVIGIRRIGKTSLIKVGIKECGFPFIYIDGRELEECGFSTSCLYRLFSEGLSSVCGVWASLRDYLRRVKGVSVAGLSIELSTGKERPSLISILKRINEWCEDHGLFTTVVIDEAQYLRFLLGGKGRVNFRSIISYCYDNLPRIKFVLTGSEVGLLMDFIGFTNPESPLYGRVRNELVLKRFSREVSMEFLEVGFKEYGMNVPKELLEYVVSKVDGIPGWLTYVGFKCVMSKRIDYELINEVAKEAVQTALTELKHLIRSSRYYALALKAIALGNERWSQIKKAIELWLGRSVTNARVSRVLETLTKMSILGKEEGRYVFLDPIIKEVAKQL